MNYCYLNVVSFSGNKKKRTSESKVRILARYFLTETLYQSINKQYKFEF